MKLKQIITQYQKQLTHYGKRLLPSHRKALDAILACRRHCGDFVASCDHCDSHTVYPLSCGHRSCPQCQHHLSERWLDRQEQKLLPVNYFMVTFTLPEGLRRVFWNHQFICYDLLFKAAAEALKTIGINNHGLELAMTGVLHTHQRNKDFHPHIHMVVPGGGLVCQTQQSQWKSFDGDYLLNEFALAKVFRGILLRLMIEQSVPFSRHLPKQWVVNVQSVGKGEKALAYLSRYLYRGVISEKDIVSEENGEVSFEYRESKTNKVKIRTLKGEQFIWTLLQHVMPRVFRRVRDFGFLHANAHLKLKRIQLLLKVKLPEKTNAEISFVCKFCKAPMKILAVNPKRIPMRFRFYLLSELPLPTE